MTSSMQRIFIGGVIFGLTCVIAVVGYMIAGWSVLDAIYMVIITVFGVGYGEAKPLSTPALKVFTMGVIVAGCSSGIYTVGGFVQMLAEGEINRALGTRRMSKGIENLAGHALICGFGRVGQMLARDLVAAKLTFVVIDNSESRVREAQALGYLTVTGSASEESTLQVAGIARARVLATVLPDDSANVFITLTARELNPTIEIIARAEAPSTEKKLRRSGANRVVLPALIGATKIAHLIIHPRAEDLLLEATGRMSLGDELRQIGLELSEIAIEPGSPLAGRAVGAIDIGGGSFVVVAIKTPDNALVLHPGPDVLLAAGDVFVLLGHHAATPRLTYRAAPPPSAVMNYRGSSHVR